MKNQNSNVLWRSFLGAILGVGFVSMAVLLLVMAGPNVEPIGLIAIGIFVVITVATLAGPGAFLLAIVLNVFLDGLKSHIRSRHVYSALAILTGIPLGMLNLLFVGIYLGSDPMPNQEFMIAVSMLGGAGLGVGSILAANTQVASPPPPPQKRERLTPGDYEEMVWRQPRGGRNFPESVR